MANTHLTIEEIMEWLYVNPHLGWQEQLRQLTALEEERKNEGTSVSHWGKHAV